MGVSPALLLWKVLTVTRSLVHPLALTYSPHKTSDTRPPYRPDPSPHADSLRSPFPRSHVFSTQESAHMVTDFLYLRPLWNDVYLIGE